MPPSTARLTGRRQSGSTAVKIVVTGPLAAGKTTLIRTISEITVLSTEHNLTDETRSVKAQTTVAMDFGRITIDRELVLFLFGTPGQDRFDFIWEILGEGMLGYVLLVDGTQEETVSAAVPVLAAFRRMASVPFVVAVNRAGHLDPAAEAWLRETLDLAPEVPVIPCDATERSSVKAVLLALLYAVAGTLEPAEAPA
jgi:small GTP-binding protein